MRASAFDEVNGEKPAKKSKASRLRFYGDQFVLDTVSGNFFRLTPTAGFILKSLIEQPDCSNLPEILEKRFGTSRARAVRDVELFLSELQSLGLIGEDPGQ